MILQLTVDAPQKCLVKDCTTIAAPEFTAVRWGDGRPVAIFDCQACGHVYQRYVQFVPAPAPLFVIEDHQPQRYAGPVLHVGPWPPGRIA